MSGGGGDGLPKSNGFVICEGCNKSIAVSQKSMHNCSLDSKIRWSLESQAVEWQTESEKKKSPTAFYLFMDDFRRTYQKEYPYVNLKDVPKLGGEKWKSFTEEEKTFYRNSAAALINSSDSDEEEEKYEMREMMFAAMKNGRS
ncbi:hypothetical protein Bca4012_014690 [Brassica carinata]